MLNQENVNKYLKHIMPKEEILKPPLKQKSNRQSVKPVLEFEDDNTGYDLKDIVKECPKINIVRDFFEFQVSQIKDEDSKLFL